MFADADGQTGIIYHFGVIFTLFLAIQLIGQAQSIV